MSESRLVLAITGASGSTYALRLIEVLLLIDVELYLLISEAGRVVIRHELGLLLPDSAEDTENFFKAHFCQQSGHLHVLGLNDWFTAPASGSAAPSAMVICPCSGGTISAIASGASDNLIERAADVVIKEGRKLILVPRESPVSVIYLENLLKLARLGVIILPASPGFYHGPQSIGDLVDFIVARLLDHLGVKQTLMNRWGED